GPGGANCTVKVSGPPFGAIVCMAGGSVTVNGNVGEVNPPTSMGFNDTFVKVTGSVTGLPPMGWGAKSTEVGEMVNDAVAVSPCPLKFTVAVAPEMFAVSVPGFAPSSVGV